MFALGGNDAEEREETRGQAERSFLAIAQKGAHVDQVRLWRSHGTGPI